MLIKAFYKLKMTHNLIFLYCLKEYLKFKGRIVDHGGSHQKGLHGTHFKASNVENRQHCHRYLYTILKQHASARPKTLMNIYRIDLSHKQCRYNQLTNQSLTNQSNTNPNQTTKQPNTHPPPI